MVKCFPVNEMFAGIFIKRFINCVELFTPSIDKLISPLRTTSIIRNLNIFVRYILKILKEDYLKCFDKLTHRLILKSFEQGEMIVYFISHHFPFSKVD